jgi:hypothetical protein
MFLRRKWGNLRKLQSGSNVKPSDYRPKFSIVVPLEFLKLIHFHEVLYSWFIASKSISLLIDVIVTPFLFYLNPDFRLSEV